LAVTGKMAERNWEGALIHPQNKASRTEKEKLAENQRTKSGNIIREVNEEYWIPYEMTNCSRKCFKCTKCNKIVRKDHR